MAVKVADDPKSKFHLPEMTSESLIMLPPIYGFEREPLVSLEKAVEPLIPLVPQVNHMVWTVKQNYTEPKDGLTIDESASIRLYTLGWKTFQSSFHCFLNRTLRSENRDDLIPWFRYLRLFLFALSKVPTTLNPILFCGIKTDVIPEYPEGRVFVWWDLISCTSSIKLLESTFDRDAIRTIFMLECHMAKDISRHSFYETEKEFLLYPARQMQVISSYDSSHHVKLIHLKEVLPSSPLIYLAESYSDSSSDISLNATQNQKLRSIISQSLSHGLVDLREQSLTDKDIPLVAELAIIHKQCKELWLQSNAITAIGTATIAQTLTKNNGLQVLILHDNPLGNSGVQCLARALLSKKSILTVLGLESTGITDEGAGYLAQMLRSNKSVISLGLGENRIGNRGVQLLASALTDQNSTLQELYLVKNRMINDSSVDALMRMLKRNQTLNRLWLDGCHLTTKGKEKLRQTTHARNRFSLSV